MKRILISLAETDRTVQFAAEELARRFSKVGGLVSRVAPGGGLHVGTFGALENSDLLPDDAGGPSGESGRREDDAVGIDIVERNDELVGYIAGTNGRSVLIAVYRVLRRLGWRWPDPYVEIAPPANEMAARLPWSYAHRPPYRHRGICIEGSVGREHVRSIIDWAPKMGFNAYFIQFREGHTFFDRWYAPRRGTPLTRTEAADIVEDLAGEIALRGLDFHAVGHGWTCEPFGVPGLGWEKHAEPIPKETKRFFAEIDGKRELFGGIALNTNLCFSSEEVRRRMSEAVADYAQTHPLVDYLHVWIGDGANNNCECAECRKMRPSDYYLMILNRIDRILTDRGLPTKIVFLAYVDLLWPPEHERFENPDRFVLMFAPITRSYSKPFEPAGALPPLGPFVRNKLTFPKAVEGNISHLRAWQDVFSGDGFDFDYHMMWDHYLDPGYEQISDILYRDVVNLSRLGLNGFMSCQVQRAFFPSGLCMYVMGEALWDPNRSFQSIRDEYYRAAFGPHAETVSRYLYRVSELFDPPSLRGEHEEAPGDAAKRFARARAFLEESGELVEKLDGEPGLVLKRHNALMRFVADALRARALGDAPGAAAAWEKAVSSLETFEEAVVNRLDTYMFRRVLGGRLFGARNS